MGCSTANPRRRFRAVSEEFGLENVHFETWDEFGLGWENIYTSVHMIEPRYMPVIAYPNPWTSGTDGKIRAPVVLIDIGAMKSETELEDYRNPSGVQMQISMSLRKH